MCTRCGESVQNSTNLSILTRRRYARIVTPTFATMTTTKELWENALVELELIISKPNFNTWFKDPHIVRAEEGTIYLGVPSQFARDWLSAKFHKDILRSLRTLSESVRNVEYVISRGPKRSQDEPRVVPPPLTEIPLEAVHPRSN